MLEAAERRVYNEPTLEAKPTRRASKKAKSAKSKLCVLGAIITFFVFGVYYTSLSAVIASKGYELEQLKSDVSRLETSNARMELTLASMSSLDKVEEIAVQKLNMTKPDAEATALVASVEPENLNQEAKGAEGSTADSQKKDASTVTAGNLYNTLISFFIPGNAQASPSTR